MIVPLRDLDPRYSLDKLNELIAEVNRLTGEVARLEGKLKRQAPAQVMKFRKKRSVRKERP